MEGEVLSEKREGEESRGSEVDRGIHGKKKSSSHPSRGERKRRNRRPRSLGGLSKSPQMGKTILSRDWGLFKRGVTGIPLLEGANFGGEERRRLRKNHLIRRVSKRSKSKEVSAITDSIGILLQINF